MTLMSTCASKTLTALSLLMSKVAVVEPDKIAFTWFCMSTALVAPSAFKSQRPAEATLAYSQVFATPPIGSPKTAFLHGVPSVNVLVMYVLLAPYRTCLVPVKIHCSPSLAQNTQVGVTGVVASAIDE